MDDDFVHLDKAEFAKLVVQSMPGSKSTDPERIAKEKLILYLTAYVLASQFNTMELQYSSEDKKKKSLAGLLSRLDSLGILAFDEVKKK